MEFKIRMSGNYLRFLGNQTEDVISKASSLKKRKKESEEMKVNLKQTRAKGWEFKGECRVRKYEGFIWLNYSKQ